MLGRILLYRRQFDEAAYHVERALSLNPNDTDVLVHAASAGRISVTPKPRWSWRARRCASTPRIPPWYTAPAESRAVRPRSRRRVIALGSQVPITMFVDVPAFLSASMALAGDLERARSYLATISRRVRRAGHLRSRAGARGATAMAAAHQSIPAGGRCRAPCARTSTGGARGRSGRRAAGSRATASVAPGPAGALSANGDTWSLDVRRPVGAARPQKGFSDIARLLQQPGVDMHCLELADRPAEPGEDAPVLDDEGQSRGPARVRELQQEIEDADAAYDLARAERAREELDRIVELWRARSASAAVRGRSAAPPNGLARLSPGASATPSRRSSGPSAPRAPSRERHPHRNVLRVSAGDGSSVGLDRPQGSRPQGSASIRRDLGPRTLGPRLSHLRTFAPSHRYLLLTS